MTHTTLGPGIAWGLTQATAPDEVRLLTVLTSASPVLDQASREYELQLMSQVIPAQRWGVPAGAGPGVTVHVKNGWLPDPGSGWSTASARSPVTTASTGSSY
jgi:hypothetical protein